jgi:hypothetical protein
MQLLRVLAYRHKHVQASSFRFGLRRNQSRDSLEVRISVCVVEIHSFKYTLFRRRMAEDGAYCAVSPALQECSEATPSLRQRLQGQ